MKATLSSINLKRNRLRHLPAALRFLPRLVELDISNNQIAIILSDAFSGTSLKRLDLAHNVISGIDAGAFADITETLVDLDLTGNSIDIFPSRALFHAQRLQSLDLQGNIIRYLPFKSIGGLKSLQRLNVAENRIYGFHHAAAGSNTPMIYFDISSNQLTTLDVLGLMRLHGNNGTGLREIRLGRNPFTCDCAILNLVNWMRVEPKLFFDKSDIRCQEPRRLRGRSFPDLFLRNDGTDSRAVIDPENRCAQLGAKQQLPKRHFLKLRTTTTPSVASPTKTDTSWTPEEHMVEAMVAARDWTSLTIQVNLTAVERYVKGFQICWRRVDGLEKRHVPRVHAHEGDVCEGEDATHRCSHCMIPSNERTEQFLIAKLKPGRIYEVCESVYFTSGHRLRKCLYEETEHDGHFKFALIGGGIGIAIALFVFGAVVKFLGVALRRNQSTTEKRRRELLKPSRLAPFPISASSNYHKRVAPHGQRQSRRHRRLSRPPQRPQRTIRLPTTDSQRRRSRNVERGYIINEAYHPHHAASLGRYDADWISCASSTRTIHSDCVSVDFSAQTSNRQRSEKRANQIESVRGTCVGVNPAPAIAKWETMLTSDEKTFEQLFQLNEASVFAKQKK